MYRALTYNTNGSEFIIKIIYLRYHHFKNKFISDNKNLRI